MFIEGAALDAEVGSGLLAVVAALVHYCHAFRNPIEREGLLPASGSTWHLEVTGWHIPFS
jgi:hypothetical protein